MVSLLLRRASRQTSKSSVLRVGLAIAMVVAGLTVVTPAPSGAASNGITVTVFDDHDADGVHDDGSATPSASDDEPGVAGVTITVFGDDDATGVSGTTDAAGSVTFAAGALPAQDLLRVELDPATLPDGFAAGYFGAASVGAGVEIVDTSGGPVTLDLPVHRPFEFCQSGAAVAATCQVAGDPTAAGFDANPHNEAIVSLDASLVGAVSVDARVDDSDGQIALGSVWGLAWDAATEQLFSAAFMKRTVGYGDGGVGAIYTTDYSSGTPTSSLLVDLAPSTVLAADESQTTNTFRNLGPTPGAEDETGFLLTGKAGLGNLTVDPAGRTLYVVNLHDKAVHSVALDGAPTVGTLPAYSVSCTDGVDRPFALTWHEGDLYLGVVCDASSAAVAGTRFVDAPPASLTAQVLRYDLDGGSWSVALAPFSLGYGRVGVHRGFCDYWGPWTDDPAHLVVTQTDPGFQGRCAPQPLLSDVDFDADGSMVLGFMDRGAHQYGARAPVPTVDGTNAANGGPQVIVTVNGGDILRAEATGGGWLLENAGADSTGSGCAGPNGQNLAPNNEGPGGGEYYCDDYFFDHDQTSMGGLATADRYPATFNTAIDPSRFESGGLYAFDDITGMAPTRRELYFDILADGSENTFNKGAGLGEVELLCAAAPLQVGDRLWYDVDGDGVQDPSEPALEGVTVHLLDGAGDPVLDASGAAAVATTDADGQFSFGLLDPGAVPASGPDSVELAPATAYTLAYDTSTTTTVLPGGLDGSFLVPTVSDAEHDRRDSDLDGESAVGASTLPSASLTTAAAGENNADTDAGFVLADQRIGNLLWLDLNDDTFVDLDEPGIGGLRVELRRETGAVAGPDAGDEMVATTTSDAEGNYWFEVLSADETYYVAVPDDQSGTTVVVDGLTIDPDTLRSSTGGTTGANDTDNGDDGAPAGPWRSVSGPIVLGAGAEPTGETDASTGPPRDAEAYIETNGATDLDDDDSNLTVDLGFRQSNRIGNLVWLDGVVGDAGYANGVADAAESADGIAAVSLELYLDSISVGVLGAWDALDTLVATTTTDASGRYDFDDLDAGTYFVAIPAGQTGQTIGGSPVDLDDLPSSPGQATASDGVDDVDDGAASGGFAALSGPVILASAATPTDEAGDFSDTTAGAAETAANAVGGVHVDAASDLTIDFGFVGVPGYALGNLVWFDVDDDGVADPGEPGIGGVTVELWPDGAVAAVATTVTDADGHYQFTSLAPGAYAVRIDPAQTGQTIGAQAVDLADLVPSATTIADPDDDVDNDANGDVQGATIATGLVNLGDPDPLSPSEPTDETLREGDATDDDPASGDAQRNLSLDVGFAQRFRIGNLVWLDSGGGVPGDVGYVEADEDNGVADASESGIEGVLVQLRDGGGTIVAETVTDAAGRYHFDDLAAGDYVVGIPTDQTPTLGAQPGLVAGAISGVRSSTGQSATPETADDDDDGAPLAGDLARSDTITLSADAEATDEGGDFADNTAGAAEAAANAAGPFRPDGHSNLEVDFGLAPDALYTIGNLVWEDLDDDGTAESGEPGIAGVLVQLLDDGGSVIAETVTDADGHYRFSNLVAGDYRVRIPTPQTPVLGTQPTIVAGALDELEPSGTPAADPEPDTDNNTDGVASVDGASSGLLTVGEGDTHSELTGETLRSDDATSDGLTTERDDRTNLGVDFGWFRGLRLGVTVFRDGQQTEVDYDNGVLDAGETRIGGVDVELWLDDGDSIFEPGGDDTLVETLTSGGDGTVVFDDLDESVPYLVAVADVPNGFSSTGISATPTTADLDDDGAPAAGYDAVTTPIVLTVGGATTGEAEEAGAGPGYLDTNSEFAVDLGFIDVPLYRIGNLVWIDADHDGLAEAGEPGLEGVLVQLLDGTDTIVAETVTDSDGLYRFENYVIGDYRVRIPESQTPVLGAQPTIVAGALDGLLSVTNGEEAAADGDADHDDNGIADASVPDGPGWLSGPVSLGPAVVTPPFGSEPTSETVRSDDATDADPDVGQPGAYPDDFSNFTVDFGFYRLGLGSTVWFDTDGDGVQDAGEPGIDGVEVRLLRDSGATLTLIDTATSATLNGVAGSVLFGGLIDGASYVLEIPASEFAGGAPLAGLISSPGGGADPDVDPTDGDDNGIDPANATNPVRSAPVTVSAGAEPTGEPSLGSGLPDDDENLTVDFGVTGLELAGTLWNDDDADGLLDGGEAVIAGAPVELLDPAGTVLAVVTTDAGGQYSFVGLEPGDYVVGVPASAFATGQPLAGLVSTVGNGLVAPDPEADPTDGDDNGNLDPTSGAVRTAAVTLAYGTEPTGESESAVAPHVDAAQNATVDLGFVPTPPMAIGNRVWLDVDNSGTLGAGESGIAAVPVELLDDAGNLVAATATDAGGYYRFDGLTPGSYRVRLPASAFAAGNVLDGFRSSTPLPIGGDSDDDGSEPGGDPVASGVVSPIVVLVPSTEPTEGAGDETDVPAGGHGPSADHDGDLTVDFGVISLSIGDRVWFDDDASGTQDPGESGVEGVEVRLLDGTGSVVALTTTGTDGAYVFTGLVPGSYSVEIGPASFAEGSPLDGYQVTTADPLPVILGTSDVTDADVGVATASVASAVWSDLDGDGVVDPGEPVFAGVALWLLDPVSGAVLATAETAADGTFRFDRLAPGTYLVEVAADNFAPGGPLEGMVSSVGTPGIDGGLDGTAPAVAIVSVPITASVGSVAPVAFGGDSVDVAFGFTTGGSIAGTVWHDDDESGTRGGAEPVQPDAVVRLYDAAGTQVAQAVADANGRYRFVGLPPGTYTVHTSVDGHESGPALTVTVALGQTIDDLDLWVLSDDLARTGSDGPRFFGLIGLILLLAGLTTTAAVSYPWGREHDGR